MHPSIARFPSLHFYNGLLEDGVSELHRPIVRVYFKLSKI
jgi:hypothetical protein